MENFTWFALAVIGVLAPPGPTNALLCTSAALVGVGRSLSLVLASMAAYLLSICTLRVVGSLLIPQFSIVGLLLRLVLIAYLLFLAWRLWRSHAPLYESQARLIGAREVFVTTLLNPKAAILAFAVLPPFTALAADVTQLATIIVAVALVGLGWIAVGGLVGAAEHKTMARLVPRAAAALLCVLAVIIAASAVAAGS